jgi:hypothetical protein
VLATTKPGDVLAELTNGSDDLEDLDVRIGRIENEA